MTRYKIINGEKIKFTSEEEALVYNILYLAGLIVQNAELQQAAAIKEQLDNQEKNN